MAIDSIKENITITQTLYADPKDIYSGWVRMNATIAADGMTDISYNADSQYHDYFIAHQRNFRKAWGEFQDYVWNRSDEFIASLPKPEEPESEAPASEAPTSEATEPEVSEG